MDFTPFAIGYVLFIGNIVYREFFLRKGIEARKIGGSKFDHGTTILSSLVILIVLLSPFLLNYLQISKEVPVLGQWLGVGIMLIGIAIHIWSVKTLGKFYSRSLIVQKEHRIVQEGPYKILRHPGYLGAILIGLGFGLAVGNMYVFWLIVLVMVPMYVFRISQEEKMLSETFGESYLTYQGKTKRLVPFIY